MATANPFELLGEDDNDDPARLVEVHQKKKAERKVEAPVVPAKLPTKPVPPAHAVREAKAQAATSRGSGTVGSRGGQGRGRGGRRGGFSGPNRDSGNGNSDGYSGSYGGGGGGQEGDGGKPLDREGGYYGGGRQSYGPPRRGGFGNGEAGGDDRPPRRVFERRSGTGHGNEFKRDGAGRGNWGTQADDVIAQETEEVVAVEDKTSTEKQPDQENAPASEANKYGKEGAANENEEKEQEDKEMTLDEYEKLVEEKRKALLAMKAQERKVEVDKDLQSMQLLSTKKDNDDVFVKLGADKSSRKQKENAEREEKAKRSVSITEFLKPAEGERNYSPSGRGRGRGRGDRGPSRGGFGRGGDSTGSRAEANIKIEDPGQFPSLGGK